MIFRSLNLHLVLLRPDGLGFSVDTPWCVQMIVCQMIVSDDLLMQMTDTTNFELAFAQFQTCNPISASSDKYETVTHMSLLRRTVQLSMASSGNSVAGEVRRAAHFLFPYDAVNLLHSPPGFLPFLTAADITSTGVWVQT